MKTKLKARVRYDEKDDCFVLELWDEDFKSWGFSRSSRCVAAKGGNGETNFIHFSFMKEIVRCAELGYSIHFKEG